MGPWRPPHRTPDTLEVRVGTGGGPQEDSTARGRGDQEGAGFGADHRPPRRSDSELPAAPASRLRPADRPDHQTPPHRPPQIAGAEFPALRWAEEGPYDSPPRKGKKNSARAPVATSLTRTWKV